MKTALLFLLSLLPSCAALAEDDARKAQEDDIREAVFRHQIAAHKSEFYFLKLVDENRKPLDPTAEFVERFKDLKASVRKRSDAKIIPPRNTVADAESGKPGLRLSVSSIKWISGEEVKAGGSVFAHGLNAAGYSYVLKKQDGKWTVTESGLAWVT